MNDVSIDVMSDIIVHMKYARYLPDLQRRETWEELVTRNKLMHLNKFPDLKDQIDEAYQMVYDRKVLPSMRSMQFAGKAIEVTNSRIYNCAYLPIDDYHAFSESMFLLLGGTGVGYSVQKHHVEKLPEVHKPNPKKRQRFLIGDSIEGWSDAIKMLMKSYLNGVTKTIEFDYRDIRPKGARLVTAGGKAPGPGPLRICIENVRTILDNKSDGSQLSPLEVHDIMCHIADAVLAGGIRRAAMISLFSADDEEMLTCKSGPWWELNGQRARANNSVVLLRHRLRKTKFMEIWDKVQASKAGEPGFYLSNDKDWGTNPCCEIGLRPFQFCNLVEINASNITSQEDFNARAKASAFIGTLQASYTDFHYLRSIWQETTEKDGLLGVSMTGIASMQVFKYNVKEAAEVVTNTNKQTALLLKINPAARTTCVKPAGTTSLVLGTSSGIHAWHSKYILRSVRVGKNEAIYSYLSIHHPELLEDDNERPHDTAVIRIPLKAPDGAVTRKEPALDLLERIKTITNDWVTPGYFKGQNGHNVSATISLRDDEWEPVSEWMWENRKSYNGLSVLPYDGGTYIQAPFEQITKSDYQDRVKRLHEINLEDVIELDDNTDLKSEAACAGGACEVV